MNIVSKVSTRNNKRMNDTEPQVNRANTRNSNRVNDTTAEEFRLALAVAKE
jgi:glycerol-3-phosphate dehydrogenase